MPVSTSISTGGSSDAVPFIKALIQCFASGEIVTLVVIGNHMAELEFAGAIVDVDLANKWYFVRRIDDGVRKKFTFRFTYRVVDASGCVVVNPQADEYWMSILQRRQDKKNEIQRMQSDGSAISVRDQGVFEVLGSVDGSIDNKKCKFYLVGGSGSNSGRAVLYATNEFQLKRALSVLGWDIGFWEAFPVLLQCHFLWVGWERLRESARQRAAEIRGSLPILQKLDESVNLDYQAGLDRQLTYTNENMGRMAMYEAAGLNHQEFGPGANLLWFEGQAVDYEAVFTWADRLPTTVLRDYLINAKSKHFYSKDVSPIKLQLEEQHKLVTRRADYPLRDHMDTLSIKRVREMMQASSSTLKARSKAPLMDFLLGQMTPDMEKQIRSESKIPNYQCLPPPGLSWDDFQFLRQDYKWMYASLNEWLLAGYAAPEAAEAFLTLG
jgi:hypothetical protein